MGCAGTAGPCRDRKSSRLNSSTHVIVHVIPPRVSSDLMKCMSVSKLKTAVLVLRAVVVLAGRVLAPRGGAEKRTATPKADGSRPATPALRHPGGPWAVLGQQGLAEIGRAHV